MIKQLNAQDVIELRDDICNFLEICFMSTFEKADKQLIETKLDGLVKYVKEGKAYLLGAFCEEQMLGFLWGYPVSSPFEIVFHIAYLSVSENGRRRGIGRNLILAAENQANAIGINKVELIVGANNIGALDFYKKMNYETDRIILNKYVGEFHGYNNYSELSDGFF